MRLGGCLRGGKDGQGLGVAVRAGVRIGRRTCTVEKKLGEDTLLNLKNM